MLRATDLRHAADVTVAATSAEDEHRFAQLRAREYARLDEQGIAYLDYTGAALYARSQIDAHHEFLATRVLGNPHSEHDPSRASSAALAGARDEVLRFLNADPGQYTVIFCANASAAIKLVAESFPFDRESHCLLTADNHNSVNGIREYARRAGARVEYVPLDVDLRLVLPERWLHAPRGRAPSLFAFPAQSNFSGVRHPLRLVEIAREGGFTVLLDAAAFVPTSVLDLREVPADFVALSFYKIFGVPTGVGALVARREALAGLERPWFAGGTIDFVSVQNRVHRLREGGESFEDGTPNFVDIAALRHGFTLLNGIGMDRVGAHVIQLGGALLAALCALVHRNGAPLVRAYGPNDMTCRGATVAFNVLSRDGRVIPFADVVERARRAGVALRGGCFCNPGAAEVALEIPADASSRCLRAEEGRPFSLERFGRCIGGDIAIGAVRASLGVPSNGADVERAVAAIASFAE